MPDLHIQSNASIVIQIFQGPARLVLDMETGMDFQIHLAEVALLPVTNQQMEPRCHGKEQGKWSVDSKESSCTSNRLAVQQSTTKLSQKFFYRFRSSTTPRDWDAFSVTYNDGGTCLSQGNIARWLKKEGDKVSPGEVLCEVETDKATVEMECMEEGYLAKILRGDGSSGIKVGEIIAITVEEEEDVGKFKDYTPSASDAAPAPKAPSAPTQTKQEVAEVPVTSPEPKVSKPSAPSSAGNRIFASPLARKLAEDHNVSLSNIKGTGPDGRIVKADIEDYLASRGKEVSQAPKADTTISAALDYTDIPHSQIRKVTALRLLQSKQTIPHYYLTVDICVDKLMELRSQLNSLQEASGGKRISVNDLVIKAAALALRKVPQCNSSWTNDYIRQYHNVNINVAVQTDNGLYVPVIKDADKKGLSKISDEVKHLAQKAKENSLKPEDYEGGLLASSNSAIINPPQAGILAVGSAEKRVIPGGGPDQYKFASFMSVTLSCDHQVIDGAIGAEWLKAFKGYIENPESMLL
ncbi:UNVERIFIED_CONTAM: pyruvate dehydrogenase complex, mitochondrial [Sesamum latifolium]|uniref:Acetyltransferase component of pyruvate dehydrogenase complex n=1 Tax=Sesamum latifolium TaxID=2727402 RepID=A0AAW2UD79_9LAMI